ncbi:hypothetical protein SLA2020_199710 [Shorea laevis]
MWKLSISRSCLVSTAEEIIGRPFDSSQNRDVHDHNPPAVVLAAGCWYHLWYQNIGRSRIDVDCMVCLRNVYTGKNLRMLPICCHCFHDSCIETWVRVSPTCPLCRINVAYSHSFLLSPVNRLGKWLQNSLIPDLRSAVCESLGYIS